MKKKKKNQVLLINGDDLKWDKKKNKHITDLLGARFPSRPHHFLQGSFVCFIFS